MVVPKKRQQALYREAGEAVTEQEEEEEEEHQHHQHQPRALHHPYHHSEDDSEDDDDDDEEEDEEEEGRPANPSTLDMIMQQQNRYDSASSSACRHGKEERRIGAGRGVRGPRQPRDKESIQARRQFRCHIPSCNKAFTERRNLAQHLKTGHSDRRPFFCTVVGCDKSFKYKCVLDKHQESCYKGPAGSLSRLPHALADSIPRQREQPPPEAMVQQQLSLRCRRTTTLSKATLRALQTADRSSALYRNLLLDSIIGTVG